MANDEIGVPEEGDDPCDMGSVFDHPKARYQEDENEGDEE